MIIQLLGVALISLLTITPTIQQNNIEQLIVPNLDININGFNEPNSRLIYEVEPHAYYNNSAGGLLTESNFNPANLVINYDFYIDSTNTFALSTNQSRIHINQNNFYINDSTNATNDSFNMTFSALRLVIREFYLKTKGNTITSETFSFTVDSSIITATSTFYTYTINGNGGLLEGRVYNRSSTSFGQSTGSKLYNVANVRQGFTLQDIVNEIQPNTTLELSDANHKIWYFYTSSPLTNEIGQQTTNLRARTNYGRSINYSTITVNVTEGDTTPPVINSITGNPTNWTNQNVTLTINATDNESLGDLNTPPYSFDNGATYQFSNQKTFTTNEIVNIRVRDLTGNFTNQQVIINRIDKQSPSVTLPSGWINQYERNTITAQQLLATYNISDNQSGVNTSLTTISNFNPTISGSYNPLISVTDNAGNTFNYTSPTVTIVSPNDTEGPSITGPTSLTRQQGNIEASEILSNFIITDISGVEPNTITIRDVNNNILINVWALNVGSYTLRVYARDTLNNVSTLDFQLIVTEPPVVDNEPPVIQGALLTSFVIETYTSSSEILALYTITDNVGVTISQLQGTINFELTGDYPVTIFASDAANNTSTLNIVVRIRPQVVLGNYNPLSDLLSGIFGAGLSMIFTLGTINVLGFRVLDGMGIIILGFVIFMVYKALRGGN
jgi:hypothetical protein